MNRAAFALFAATMLMGAACGKKEEPAKAAPASPPATAPATQAPPSASVPASSVVPRNYTLGNAIGADKKVMAPVNAFVKNDTAYVSVDLFGAGEANLKARWTYKDKDGKVIVVKEDAMKLNVTAPITVEFHVSKPDGLPAGGYEVELFVNDVSTGKKPFTVK